MAAFDSENTIEALISSFNEYLKNNTHNQQALVKEMKERAKKIIEQMVNNFITSQHASIVEEQKRYNFNKTSKFIARVRSYQEKPTLLRRSGFGCHYIRQSWTGKNCVTKAIDAAVEKVSKLPDENGKSMEDRFKLAAVDNALEFACFKQKDVLSQSSEPVSRRKTNRL